MPKKETKEYIAEEDLLYDTPDDNEELEVDQKKSNSSLALIVFLCVFLPIAGFVAGVQYISYSVVPTKTQPLRAEIDNLQQANQRLQTEVVSFQEELVTTQNANEMLRLATSLVDTVWLVPNIYRVEDSIISIEPSRERVIFEDIDVRSFKPVAEFSENQTLNPIADGGYTVRWFSDDNHLYCLEGKGVAKSVKLAQPIEVQFSTATNDQALAKTDMWFKDNESNEGREYGYVTFYQSETNQLFDLTCQLIEPNDNS